MRRARPWWRIPLAVAMVALPLAGVALLAAAQGNGPPPADHAAVIQPLIAPGAAAPAVRPSGGTTDPARMTAAARALGLVAVLLAEAGVAVVATGGCAVPATVGVGRRGRGLWATGRGPPLLPR